MEPADRSCRFLDCGGPAATAREHGRLCTFPSSVAQLRTSNTAAALSTLAAGILLLSRTSRISPSVTSVLFTRLAWSCYPYLRLRCASRVISADHDGSFAGPAVDDRAEYSSDDRSIVANRIWSRYIIFERRRDDDAPILHRRACNHEHYHDRVRRSSACPSRVHKRWRNQLLRNYATTRIVVGSATGSQ